MKKFVFWTGIYNIVAGLGFYFPFYVRFLGLKIPDPSIWLGIVAATIAFSGIVLVLCSRNLEERAPIVFWEGFLRLYGFIMLGLLSGWGLLAVMLGLLDVIIGLVYFVGLPRAVNRSAVDLLLDRSA